MCCSNYWLSKSTVTTMLEDASLTLVKVQPEEERERMLSGHNFIILPSSAPQIFKALLGEVNMAVVQNSQVEFRKTRLH